MFLPGYTVLSGKLYPSDTVSTQIASSKGATGYGWKKFVTENYSGDMGFSGDDIVLMLCGGASW